MDLDEQETRKLIFTFQTNKQKQSSVSPRHNNTTPKNSKYIKKSINPRTPKGQGMTYSMAASSSLVSGNNSSVHSISMAVVQTPPAKRYQRVKNPFEAALADRLHLPLIASPSLFQRPNTPQMSSTQFEWTIDEVSSLKPANVEPHETQFQDSPDPELEAKAQSAISSYFKEQQIVPSPIDCPLRSQRIILSEINGNTPVSKPGRRIRDCASQTELTLPPILPPALEDALKPYFQPQLAGANIEFEKSSNSRSWLFNNNDTKDTSLRRKLFDMHNIVVLENDNQRTPQAQMAKITNNSAYSNSSPISLNCMQHTAIVGKLSDSSDNSFGSLSPISASDSLSPNCRPTSATKRKIKFGNFAGELEDIELLSPIQPLVRRKPLLESNRSENRMDTSKNDLQRTNNTSSEGDENERFTPERSSSPLCGMVNNNIAEFSTDSFNVKISRLKVNSSKSQSIVKGKIKPSSEIDVFDIEDMLDNTVDMDDMQVSQLSGQSSNCSSLSDTPRSKRRSASRKNLSQSFSANLQDEGEEEQETPQSIKMKEVFSKKIFGAITTTTKVSSSFSEISNKMEVNTTPKKNETFYRTDSGFNEMSQNSSSCEAMKSLYVQQSLLQQQQEYLVCCSTPSKKDNFNFIV